MSIWWLELDSIEVILSVGIKTWMQPHVLRADRSFCSSSLLVDKDESRPRLTTGISTNGTSKSPPFLSLRIYFSGSSSPLRSNSWTLFCTIGVLKAGAESAMLRVWKKADAVCSILRLCSGWLECRLLYAFPTPKRLKALFLVVGSTYRRSYKWMRFLYSSILKF